MFATQKQKHAGRDVLLANLVQFMIDYERENGRYPSMASLMGYSGKSLTTVKAWLEELKGRGVVSYHTVSTVWYSKYEVNNEMGRFSPCYALG